MWECVGLISPVQVAMAVKLDFPLSALVLTPKKNSGGTLTLTLKKISIPPTRVSREYTRVTLVDTRVTPPPPP